MRLESTRTEEGRVYLVCLLVLSFAPITVSTASVLIFLMIEGFGFPLARYLYPVALLGVATAALWG